MQPDPSNPQVFRFAADAICFTRKRLNLGVNLSKRLMKTAMRINQIIKKPYLFFGEALPTVGSVAGIWRLDFFGGNKTFTAQSMQEIRADLKDIGKAKS
ncbi:MAG TPA: hypothetical protein VJ654_19895 [Noviherbaspirillum sp.]|nr:hypothetical protein [Noviherbaspirillum sp.]